MKQIGWMLVLSLLFSSCSTYFQQNIICEQVVVEVTCVESQFYPDSENLWREDVDVEPAKRPYRKHRRKRRKGKSKARRKRTKKERKTSKRKNRIPCCETSSEGSREEGKCQSRSKISTSGSCESVAQDIEKPTNEGNRRGRPKSIATNHVFCPQQGCLGHNQLGPNKNHQIVGAGTYTTAKGEKRQMYRCELCRTRFSETKGTVFFGLKTDEQTVYRALASLAEGMGIRPTARVFEVDKDTILMWLKRAGQHCQQVSHYMMQNLHVDQVQLDELWTFVKKKEKKLSLWERLYTEYGDTWVWTAVDPVHKLVLAFLVGEREEEQAQGLIKRLFSVLAKDCLPLLTSDKLPHYAQAILKVLGQWVKPKRKGSRGRHPKPHLKAPADLHYATVCKKYKQSTVVSVTTKLVFGKPREFWARLKKLGINKINTAFVERMNLTLRHLLSRLRRKGLTFSKKRLYLKWHLELSVAYYHFVLPHLSLRRALPKPIATKGSGSPKKWEATTPAMSAGLTDHVWTIRELLSMHVPVSTAA